MRGVIFYCDGSCGPSNPGFMGWGCHGYHYEIKEISKPFTADNHLITNKGYLNATEQSKYNYLLVEPITYFDIIGSDPNLGTNNKAELLAIVGSLEKSLSCDVTEINIFTDSEYVVNGVNKWVHQWKKSNWLRHDGTQVSNSDVWQTILVHLDAIKANGVKLNVSWVKGHSDIFGNIKADMLATIGMNRSQAGKFLVQADSEPAAKYWNKKTERHPFINFNSLYFNTLEEHNVPGKYFQSNPGKDTFIIGKRIPDACYSVINVTEPVATIEAVKRKHYKITNGYNVIGVIKLDRLFNPEISDYISKYEECALYRDKRNFNLNFVDRKPLSLEVNPSGLSMRAIEAFNCLEELLVDYKIVASGGKGSDFNDFIDITDRFYDIEEKTVKKEVRSIHVLKPEITSTSSEMLLDIPYRTATENLKVPISLGLDLLPRNNLKRLEAHSPKIVLVLWQETRDVLRYATIVDCGIGIGLWSNYFCDRLFVK